MASWRDEYIHALKVRDEREKSSCRIDSEYIESYSALLDQVAALEAEKAALEAKHGTSRKDSNSSSVGQVTPGEGNAQLRADLTDALRSKGQLQSKLKVAEAELVRLRTKAKADIETVKTLSRQHAVLTQKVKDRDEELKGKTKHSHDVQDEMISLNLQLNIAEQKAKKLATENQDLIDRWMARKGREADEMNSTLQ